MPAEMLRYAQRAMADRTRSPAYYPTPQYGYTV